MAQIAFPALVRPAFDTAAFLANAGLGRTIVQLAQGVFLFPRGSCRLGFLSSERQS